MKKMSKSEQMQANGGKYYKIHCNGCGRNICGGTKLAAEFMNGVHVSGRKSCYGKSVYIGWC
ncbi:MAG: hypothetical protein NC205_02480 [Prevotella sp.]|nr:hypothetical protein [Alistipes senegalensis]MCM1357435.1 hypothetical protein [Prevotella sp.]MCM1473146.1 hypothetical protein [Muribaculaceae bacterium]MDE6425804.1 hypothetical protein [Ruminococcus sp.]